MDWIRTKSDEAALDAGYRFDIRLADKVRYFFSRFLRHSKGQFAGKAFELLDWEWERIIGPLFGWRRPDGTRRFRRVGCALPKKNGKSTLLSALSIYAMMADGEAGAEVYSAAASRQQASIIYEEAANMVEASPALLKRIKVRRSGKILRHPKSRSLYQALSADVPTKEGLNIHWLLFDELHAQKSMNLWNTLRYGGAARREPVIFWITTAGVLGQSELCEREWKRAKDVQEGRVIDLAFLPCIYETKQDADWTAPTTWAAVNPSFGTTLKVDDFKEECEKAKESSTEENNFKRYRLNMWVRQVTKWLQWKKWDDCRVALDLDKMRGPGRIGLDLACTTDIAAAVYLEKRDNRYAMWPFFWLPESALDTRDRANLQRLEPWVDAGLITLTEGDVIDFGVIRKFINEFANGRKIEEIAIDPWNATQIATDLQSDGFKVQYVRTGFISISAATKEFERLVLRKEILHGGHPVMDWMIENVSTEVDASGNIKPSKRRSAEKIDGPVAAILALARYIGNVTPKRSKYNKQGLTIL